MATTEVQTEQHLILDPSDGPAIERIILSSSEPVTLGRSAGADHQLPDPAVSRKHVTVSCRGGTWMMTDLGSRNGAFVNGVQVEPKESAPLASGDRIRIGPWTFVVNTGKPATTGSITTVGKEPPRSTVQRVGQAAQPNLERRRLEALLDCSLKVSATETDQELAAVALSALIEGAGFPRAALIRPGTGTDQIEVVAVRTLEGPTTPESILFSRSLIRAAQDGDLVQLNTEDIPNHGQSIIQLGICSAICAPILVGDAVMAYLYLDARQNEGSVQPDAAPFCAAVARMCGLALSNIQRLDLERRRRAIESELHAAREAQQLIMPELSGERSGMRFALRSLAGRFVAGDLFNVVDLPENRTAIYMGDVAGKGMSAAILMTAAQTNLAAALRSSGDLGAAVAEVNRHIAERSPAHVFVTLWAGVFDPATRTLEFVDAGHGHWLHRASMNQPFADLEYERSLVLGLEPDEEYASQKLTLESGARVVLYSDGVVEQSDGEGELFRKRRTIEALEPSTSAEEDVEKLLAAVRAFSGRDEMDDDTTIASFEAL